MGTFSSADLGDGVRALTLSNPARKNALDAASLAQLRAALTEPLDVRCWLLRSAGEGPFSSGYDVEALTEIGEGRLPDEELGDVFDLLANHRAPSVALLTGAAYGAGCELACACDFRVGDTRAAFCLPPAKLGIIYAPRGIQRIAAITGLSKAKWLLFTGKKLGAKEAEKLGLLDQLHLVDTAEDEALNLARSLAAAAPQALAGMKKIFQTLATTQTDPQTALRRAAFNSEDAKEGRAAFLEKRPPNFTGS